MPYTPIVGCLGYVLSEDRQRVLLVHRNAREDDDQLGKYNGLGGKMEPGEEVLGCMRRELMEEARIDCPEPRLRGIINWTNFGPKGEDWLGFVFLIDAYEGSPPAHNEEGSLEWHPVDSLLTLPMWEGDRHFLPLVFDGDPRIFYGHMPYEGDRPLSWSYQRV